MRGPTHKTKQNNFWSHHIFPFMHTQTLNKIADPLYFDTLTQKEVTEETDV